MEEPALVPLNRREVQREPQFSAPESAMDVAMAFWVVAPFVHVNVWIRIERIAFTRLPTPLSRSGFGLRAMIFRSSAGHVSAFRLGRGRGGIEGSPLGQLGQPFRGCAERRSRGPSGPAAQR